MSAIRNILFPVDFSERSCNTASFVAALMNGFSATATLLNVVEPLTYLGYGDGPPLVVDLEEIRRDSATCLQNSLVKEFEKLPVKRVVEIGNAADTILDYADANDVDLIMMPTRGRGPFRSFLLGSVTSKVLHDAECPVWTAAHTEEAPLKEHLLCSSVLCAVDGSANSLPVLRWAEDFAKNLGASLRVMHVIQGPAEWIRRNLDRDLEVELRRQARTMVENLQRTAGIDAPICIGVGDVGASIKTEAITHGADLVIIGRGALHERLGRLRAHSLEIIRTAPCPVISV